MFARGSLLCGVLVLPLLASPALSDIIDVPNASFEGPTVANASPYATPNIDNWQKAPAPAWWTGAGYSAEQWDQSTGIFLDVPFAHIDNVDKAQVAFMFAAPGLELFQDLTATFDAGKSYHLTVGIEGGGYGMPIGTSMELRLYYRDEDGNRVTVDAKQVTNTNASGSLSHLTDYTLDIPSVTAGDAWAGKNIGVQLIQTTLDPQLATGYWDMDNVRLTSAVPEPGSMALLAIGLGLFVARRWRASKR